MRLRTLAGRVVPAILASGICVSLISFPPLGPLALHAAVLGLLIGIAACVLTIVIAGAPSLRRIGVLLGLSWFGAFLGFWTAPLLLYLGALVFPALMTYVGSFLVAQPTRREGILVSLFVMVPLLIYGLLGVISDSPAFWEFEGGFTIVIVTIFALGLVGQRIVRQGSTTPT